jgi:hypothetical protein
MGLPEPGIETATRLRSLSERCENKVRGCSGEHRTGFAFRSVCLLTERSATELSKQEKARAHSESQVFGPWLYRDDVPVRFHIFVPLARA